MLSQDNSIDNIDLDSALFDVLVPLIRTTGVEPGAPDGLVICTPATFPCNDCMGETAGTAVRSLPRTEDTAPVRSDFLTTPYPITTTSSRVCVSGCNTTSNAV